MDVNNSDARQIVWFYKEQPPECCTVCGHDIRGRGESIWVCGCRFGDDGDLIVECDCSSNGVLVCGRYRGEAAEGLWG